MTDDFVHWAIVQNVDADPHIAFETHDAESRIKAIIIATPIATCSYLNGPIMSQEKHLFDNLIGSHQQAQAQVEGRADPHIEFAVPRPPYGNRGTCEIQISVEFQISAFVASTHQKYSVILREHEHFTVSSLPPPPIHIPMRDVRAHMPKSLYFPCLCSL